MSRITSYVTPHNALRKVAATRETPKGVSPSALRHLSAWVPA